MTYLIKPPRTSGLSQLQTADDLMVRLADVHRVKRTHESAIGTMRELEVVGSNPGKLRIAAAESRAPSGTRPYPGIRGYGIHVRRRPSDLHAVVRRMADDDLAAVAECDAEIEALREKIAAVRSRRAAHVKAAWARGGRVPLSELEALIPEDGS